MKATAPQFDIDSFQPDNSVNIIYALCRAALEIHPEHTDAQQLVTAWLGSRPDLQERSQVFAIQRALEDVIRERTRFDRPSYWRGGGETTPSPNTMRGVSLLARAERKALMEYPMPGGRPLGDFTRPEVLEVARQQMAQARGTYRNGKWLQLVAKAMTSDRKHVRNELTEEQLASFQTKAETLSAKL